MKISSIALFTLTTSTTSAFSGQLSLSNRRHCNALSINNDCLRATASSEEAHDKKRRRTLFDLAAFVNSLPFWGRKANAASVGETRENDSKPIADFPMRR
jgi:hypothetical protein